MHVNFIYFFLFDKWLKKTKTQFKKITHCFIYEQLKGFWNIFHTLIRTSELYKGIRDIVW